MSYNIIIPADHIDNQRYSDYIQPANQNIFNLLDARISPADPVWYNKEILDFGCNVGHLLRYSNGKIKNYTGVDIQSKPLEIAKQEFKFAKWIHYNGFHHAFNSTGDKIFPKLEKTFDYIMCIGVFTHCDFDTICRSILYFKSILKPGGKIYFSLWETEHFRLYTEVFLKQKFNISIGKSVLKPFDRCIYLVDRVWSVTDVDKVPFSACAWLETFYNRDFIINTLGATVAPGPYSKHTIFSI